MSSWPAALDRRPAGVVFDCDGLLVDTEPSWEWANEELFVRRGRNPAEVDNAQLFGRSTNDTAALLAHWLGETGREAAVREELLATVAGRMPGHATALPGAVELVGSLRELGVPVAVASNSPPEILTLSLGLGGFADSFDAVVSFGDVPRPKPAPDPYLEACRRLGVRPSAAVGFEDSPTGLAAVRAAGLASVGVPRFPGEFPADWVLPSLAHPGLAEWVGSWA